MTEQTKPQTFHEFLKATNPKLTESLVVAGVEVVPAVAGTEQSAYAGMSTGEDAKPLPKIEAPTDNMSIAKAGLAMLQSAGIKESVFVQHLNNIQTMLG